MVYQNNVLLSITILLFLSCIFSGCSIFKSDQIDIVVQSSEYCNGGRPFYMLVRMIDQKSYITESYQEVAEKVFQDNEQSVIKTESIYPGKEKKVYLDMQDKSPMAIYFLFTEPTERWKKFFALPLPKTMKFEIEGNGIKD